MTTHRGETEQWQFGMKDLLGLSFGIALSLGLYRFGAWLPHRDYSESMELPVNLVMKISVNVFAFTIVSFVVRLVYRPPPRPILKDSTVDKAESPDPS